MTSWWISALARLSLGLLLFGCSKPTLSAPPAPAETRDGRWEQDVRYVTENVARLHVDAFRFTSRAGYEAARDELLASIGELSDAQIILRLASIVARLRDAHTQLPIPLGSKDFPLAPCHIERDSTNFYLLGVPRAQQALLRARIVGVGGVPLAKALARLGEVLSHENEVGILVEAPALLRTPVVLHELGLAPRDDTVELLVEIEGEQRECSFTIATDAARENDMVYVQQEASPFAQQRKDENYWYEKLTGEDGCLYLAYNACSEDPDRPFADFAEEVLEVLTDPGIQRLIVDLRTNQGGSQIVAWPLFQELEDHRLDHPGGIVVLIGSKTFSSGKGNALDLRDWTDAVLIGRPTRQRPNTFGQIGTFRSPNHELVVSYSTKYFRRGADDETTVRPDIDVSYSLEQLIEGFDAALEAARSYTP